MLPVGGGERGRDEGASKGVNASCEEILRGSASDEGGGDGGSGGGGLGQSPFPNKGPGPASKTL